MNLLRVSTVSPTDEPLHDTTMAPAGEEEQQVPIAPVASGVLAAEEGVEPREVPVSQAAPEAVTVTETPSVMLEPSGAVEEAHVLSAASAVSSGAAGADDTGVRRS